MRDTDNQTNESDTTERAGSLAEQRCGTVLDSAADIAHDRHDVAIFEEAARRQELDLDNPQPLDASRNLAERVRATFGRTTAEAEADAEADAEARHGRAAERDGEKLTPILASLALLRKKSERARGPAPRLRPAPNVGRKPPGRGLVGGGKIKERRAPAAPRNAGRGGPAPRL